MRLRHLLLLPLAFVFASCSSIREGVVVEKKGRLGMDTAYATHLSFRYSEPDVYWVRIEGHDDQGRTRQKTVILFRHDWGQLRVGDHWSRDHGFSPAEAMEK